MQALEARGYFSDEDETVVQAPGVEKMQLGALKRAALGLGRKRPDIIYSLPEDKVAALAAAPLPYPDRKARARPHTTRKVGLDELLASAQSHIHLQPLPRTGLRRRYCNLELFAWSVVGPLQRKAWWPAACGATLHLEGSRSEGARLRADLQCHAPPQGDLHQPGGRARGRWRQRQLRGPGAPGYWQGLARVH